MKRIFLFFFLTLFGVSAQAEADNDSTIYVAIYVIAEIEFAIDGRSRPFALMNHGEFIKGRRISGSDNLQAYLALKRQLLLNQRILETVDIEYVLGEAQEDGAIPVSLLVRVQDARNLIILPAPQYSTSDGLSLGLWLRDYNFLGSMSALGADFNYRQRGNDRSFNFSIESNTPFYAAGLTWSVLFNHYFDHTVGLPFFYHNITGIAVQLPWRTTTFTVGLHQHLVFNEEPGPESALIYGITDTYRPYGGTALFVSHRIPLGQERAAGQLTYTPRISGRINYPTGDMDEVRTPSVTVSHALEFGRVNWVGNYRQGLWASVGNAYTWHFNRTDAPFRIMVDGSITLHQIITDFLGFSTRLGYRQKWQWSDVMNAGSGGWIPYFDAGNMIRGIPDASLWRNQESGLQADRVLSLNVDLPIRVMDFEPSRWLNSQRLRLFDFQMHFSPFMDFALLQGPDNDFNLQDMITTAGFELIFFSGFFRNLQIRASVGYNLDNFRGMARWDEIFIGTSFHY